MSLKTKSYNRESWRHYCILTRDKMDLDLNKINSQKVINNNKY